MAGIQNLVMDVQSCACGTMGACQTQCATEYCMTGMVTTGDACDTCLNNAVQTADGGMGPCFNQVVTACMNNPDCAAYITCANGCP